MMKHKYTITSLLFTMAFGIVVGCVGSWFYFSQQLNTFKQQSAYSAIHNTYAPLSDLHEGDTSKAKHFLEEALRNALLWNQTLSNSHSGGTPPGLTRQAEHLLSTLQNKEETEPQFGHVP